MDYRELKVDCEIYPSKTVDESFNTDHHNSLQDTHSDVSEGKTKMSEHFVRSGHDSSSGVNLQEKSASYTWGSHGTLHVKCTCVASALDSSSRTRADGDVAEDNKGSPTSTLGVRQNGRATGTLSFKSRTSWRAAFVLFLVIAVAHAEDFSSPAVPETSSVTPSSILLLPYASGSNVRAPEAPAAVSDQTSFRRWGHRKKTKTDGSPRKSLPYRRASRRKTGKRQSHSRREHGVLDGSSRRPKSSRKKAAGFSVRSRGRQNNRKHPLTARSSSCTVAPSTTQATLNTQATLPTQDTLSIATRSTHQKTERDTRKLRMGKIETSVCNTTLSLREGEDRRVGFLTSKDFPHGKIEAPYECIFRISENANVIVYFTEWYLRANLSVCDERYTAHKNYGSGHPMFEEYCDTHMPISYNAIFDIFDSFIYISVTNSDDTDFRVGCGDFDNRYGFNLTYEIVPKNSGYHHIIDKNNSSHLGSCNYNGIPTLQQGSDGELYFVCVCFPAFRGPSCQYGPLHCYTEGDTSCMNSSSKGLVPVSRRKRHGMCDCVQGHVCSECNEREVCNNHGTCRMLTGQFHCDCAPDHFGLHCEDSYLSVHTRNKSECNIDGRECEHTCHRLQKHFCSCPAGYHIVNETDCAKNEMFEISVEFPWDSENLDIIEKKMAEINEGIEIIKTWPISHRDGKVRLEYSVTNPEAIKKLTNVETWKRVIPVVKSFKIRKASALSMASIKLQNYSNELRLMCAVVGSSEMIFEWLKDNFTLSMLTDMPCISNQSYSLSFGRIFIRIQSENEKCTSYLTIKNKKLVDLGRFSCRVRDGFQMSTSSLVIPKHSDHLTVEVWPPVVTVFQGGNATLHCSVQQVWKSHHHYDFTWYPDKEASAVGRTYHGSKQTILWKGSNFTMTNITVTVNMTCHVLSSLEDMNGQATARVVVLSQKAEDEGPRYCNPEEHLQVLWHLTEVNSHAVERCPDHFKGLARRECEEQRSGKPPRWARPNFAGCIYEQLMPFIKQLDLFDSGYPVIGDWNSFAGLVLNVLDKRQEGMPAVYPGEGLTILNVTARMKFLELLPQSFFQFVQYLAKDWGTLCKQNIRDIAGLIQRYHMERLGAHKSSSVTLTALNATSDAIEVQEKVFFQGSWNCRGNNLTSPQHIDVQVSAKDPSIVTSVTLFITVILHGPRLIDYGILAHKSDSENKGSGLVIGPLVFVDIPNKPTYNFITTVSFHLSKNYLPSVAHQLDGSHVSVCGQAKVHEVGEDWSLSKCTMLQQTGAEDTSVVTCMCDGTGVVSLLRVRRNITVEYAGWESNIAVGVCCSTCGLALLLCAVLLLLQPTCRMPSVKLRVAKTLSLAMAFLVLAYIALRPIAKESYIVVLVVMGCCVVFSSGVSISQQMILHQQLSSVQHVLPVLPAFLASPAALATALVSLMSLALGGILWTMQYVKHFDLSGPWVPWGPAWGFLLTIGIFLALTNATWLFVLYANICQLYNLKNPSSSQDMALPMGGQMQYMAVLHLLEICFVAASLFRNHEKTQIVFCLSAVLLSVMVITYQLIVSRGRAGCFTRIIQLRIGENSGGHIGAAAGVYSSTVGEIQNTVECPKNDTQTRTAELDFRQRGGSMLSQATTTSILPDALSDSSYNTLGALGHPSFHYPRTVSDTAMGTISKTRQHEKHNTHVGVPGSCRPGNTFLIPENGTLFDSSKRSDLKQQMQGPFALISRSPDFKLNQSSGLAVARCKPDFHETPVESWKNGLQVFHDLSSLELSKEDNRYLPMDPKLGKKNSYNTEIPSTFEADSQAKDVGVPFLKMNPKADVGRSVKKKILDRIQKRKSYTSSKHTYLSMIPTANFMDGNRTKAQVCYSNIPCSFSNLSSTLPCHEKVEVGQNESMDTSLLTCSNPKITEGEKEKYAEELATLNDRSQELDENDCENICSLNRANSVKLKLTSRTQKNDDVEHKDCCKPLLQGGLQKQEIEVIQPDIAKKLTKGKCWGDMSPSIQVDKDYEEEKELCASELDGNAIVQTKNHGGCRLKVRFLGEQNKKDRRKNGGMDSPIIDCGLEKKPTLLVEKESTFRSKSKYKSPVHTLVNNYEQTHNSHQCFTYKCAIDCKGQGKKQYIVDKGGGVPCPGTTATATMSEDVQKNANYSTRANTVDDSVMVIKKKTPSPKFNPKSSITASSLTPPGKPFSHTDIPVQSSPIQINDSVSIHSSPSHHDLSVSPSLKASFQSLEDCPDITSSVSHALCTVPVQVCSDAPATSIQVQGDKQCSANVDCPFLKNSASCDIATDEDEDLSIGITSNENKKYLRHDGITVVHNIVKSKSTIV